MDLCIAKSQTTLAAKFQPHGSIIKQDSVVCLFSYLKDQKSFHEMNKTKTTCTNEHVFPFTEAKSESTVESETIKSMPFWVSLSVNKMD